ncbi:MAG: hypothetical protein BRC48_13785 [Cyanobacteria bacterium QS_9_48_30]|nr:MAG: hypothetical protein BRC48_13785 [Cyanobacteria bacterium QS_9_48_30]
MTFLRPQNHNCDALHGTFPEQGARAIGKIHPLKALDLAFARINLHALTICYEWEKGLGELREIPS